MDALQTISKIVQIYIGNKKYFNKMCIIYLPIKLILLNRLSVYTCRSISYFK